MNKKTDEEYGIVITREMKAMILNSEISYEDRAKIMCSILSGEELEDLMMRAFADSLRTGFEKINDSRKKSIENRRIRQAEYQRNRRSTSTVDERPQTHIEVDTSTVDERQSNSISVDERASLGIARHSIAKQCNNIPLNPPEGDGHCPPEISIEDVFPEVKNNSVEALADAIEATEAFAHMRVKRRKLLRALNLVLKKNTGAEIMEGIERWTKAWAEEGWQYCPGSISDWISDGKFLQLPREKKNEGANYDDVGVKEIV